MVSVQHPRRSSAVFPIAATAVILSAVVAALVVVGSPAKQRMRRSDGMRVQDLQYLKSQIDMFQRQRRKLPGKLEELKALDADIQIKDPESQSPYLYRSLGRNEYELGATFKTDTSRFSDASDYTGQYTWYVNRNLPFWKHTTGPVTFRVKVDPGSKTGE